MSNVYKCFIEIETETEVHGISTNYLCMNSLPIGNMKCNNISKIFKQTYPSLGNSIYYLYKLIPV